MSEPSLGEIVNLLGKFEEYYSSVLELKQKYKRRIRLPNFPEWISENLVKYMMCDHDVSYLTKRGDLSCRGQKIEVKCFSSTGPSSFGPTEDWDIIYFLDATNHMSGNFTCYKIAMNNIDFGLLRINKIETYNDQICQKRRPRITFKMICPQINSDKISVIFRGNITDLVKIENEKLSINNK